MGDEAPDCHWLTSTCCISTWGAGSLSRFYPASVAVLFIFFVYFLCVRVVFSRMGLKTGGLLTGGVCVSVPLLASRLRMLLSDICSRAAMGGTLDSVAGSRVTSAFMSLNSSSN